MNIFNRVDCLGGGRNRNTGFDCVLTPKAIKGGAYVPSTFKLTKAQLATPGATLAALKAAAKADLPENRIFPFHNLINPADNSEDKIVRTATDGTRAVVRDGMMDWSWEFTIGGLALHTALRTHNQNGGYFIFWDSDYVLFGWGKDREIYGIPVNYKWVNPWKMETGDTTAIFALQIVFDPRYINQEMGFAKLNNTLTDVKGLRDIAIILNEFSGDDGTGNFSLLTEDSAYNLYDLYNTQLGTATVYIAINSQTGEEIDITSVTPKAGDKTFDFVLDTMDEDYPTEEGDIIVISMIPVSELEALGVEGFEGLSMELEIAANS